MISIRNIASLTKLVRLQANPMASFSNNWKERDEAAEKVYISRAESNSFIYPIRINHEETAQKD